MYNWIWSGRQSAVVAMLKSGFVSSESGLMKKWAGATKPVWRDIRDDVIKNIEHIPPVWHGYKNSKPPREFWRTLIDEIDHLTVDFIEQNPPSNLQPISAWGMTDSAIEYAKVKFG